METWNPPNTELSFPFYINPFYGQQYWKWHYTLLQLPLEAIVYLVCGLSLLSISFSCEFLLLCLLKCVILCRQEPQMQSQAIQIVRCIYLYISGWLLS